MSENVISQVQEGRDPVKFFSSVQGFLDQKCPPTSGLGVPCSEVAKAVGLSEDEADLIAQLIRTNFFPGWGIRPGRGGGACRLGETPVRTDPAKKVNDDWLGSLKSVLDQHVPLLGKGSATRNDIARELAKVTGEDVLSLPAKISNALTSKLVPGFESKRGAGICRVEVKAAVEAVSAEGTSVEGLVTETPIAASTEQSSTPVTETPASSTVETTTETSTVSTAETQLSGQVMETTAAPAQEAQAIPAVETVVETLPEVTPTVSETTAGDTQVTSGEPPAAPAPRRRRK